MASIPNLEVYLKDFPTSFPEASGVPAEWVLTIPSPPNPDRLGPFRPVAGSSAIYTFVSKNDTNSTEPLVYTLCRHLPISKPTAHPSDPNGDFLWVQSGVARSGRESWGVCEWKAHPNVPGAVLGTFTRIVGFGSREGEPEDGLFAGFPPPPITETLLRPAPNYAATPTTITGPRHYPWTRATATSTSGVVSFLFYDRNNDQNAPLTPPHAGMQVIYRLEKQSFERSTSLMITEMIDSRIDVATKFRGWINGAETDVLLSRVETNYFWGTVLEAHPGFLPNGRQCFSGLVTFVTIRD